MQKSTHSLDLYTLGLNNKTEASVERERGFIQFFLFPSTLVNYMKKKLIKQIEERLYEAEVTLQFFKEEKKPEELIEQQEDAIQEIKKFLEFLKK